MPSKVGPLQSRPSSPDLRFHMLTDRPVPTTKGRRIVICDYNALLLSVTGLLRMSDYAVFQAHDGWAAQELCTMLPDIELLVLNTYRTGIDVGELCNNVRAHKPGIAILHIGSTIPDGLPDDVPTLPEDFTADSLLMTVRALVEPGRMRAGPTLLEPKRVVLNFPNGRRRDDVGPRRVAVVDDSPKAPVPPSQN
jgi:CheY-like chemotaxis protein